MAGRINMAYFVYKQKSRPHVENNHDIEYQYRIKNALNISLRTCEWLKYMLESFKQKF